MCVCVCVCVKYIYKDHLPNVPVDSSKVIVAALIVIIAARICAPTCNRIIYAKK